MNWMWRGTAKKQLDRLVALLRESLKQAGNGRRQCLTEIAPFGVTVWSSWNSLGGVITSDPIVSHDADGRLEVFARGTDGAVWHIWQTSPGGGWSGWASLGGVVTSLCAVYQNADGRLEVFARGTDDAVWHNLPDGTERWLVRRVLARRCDYQ
jgi:acylphosphatase